MSGLPALGPLGESGPANTASTRTVPTVGEAAGPHPPLASTVLQQFSKNLTTREWARVTTNALSFFASAALSVAVVLGIIGVLSTPVGWGIALGVLAVALAAAFILGASKGDSKQDLKELFKKGFEELWTNIGWASLGCALPGTFISYCALDLSYTVYSMYSIQEHSRKRGDITKTAIRLINIKEK